jgi:glutaminase
MSIRTRATQAIVVLMLIAASVISVGLSAQSRGSANRSAVAPQDEFVKRTVDEAYARFRSDTTGKNADYIPYLA